MAEPRENQGEALLPTSAAHLATAKVPMIAQSATVGDIESLLLKETRNLETIHYIYVVEPDRKLVGIVSLKEVFRSPKERRIADIMTRNLVTARPHTSRERVALLAIEHKLKEIPVVDHEGKLVGVVPGDTILAALHEEHIEDFLKFAGIHRFTDPAKTILTASAGTLIEKRLPWLIVGLLGGLGASFIIGLFETAIASKLILASFIPAIVYIADAVGTQTQTIFIRSLAMNRGLSLASYLGRELKIGIAIALILGILMGGVVTLIWKSAALGLILSLSFFVGILSAIAAAIFFPWFFTKMKIDPAIASGPFATIVRDLLSLTIYLGIASLILRAIHI